MKNQRPGFVSGLALGAALSTAALVGAPLLARSGETTPQAGGSGKGSVKVVLDNAKVRVRDVTFAPGSSGMHTHELAHVGVVIQGGTLVFKYPDGKQETAKLDAGGVGYRDANVTHEPVNTGTTPVRVIEVELK